MVNFQRDQAFAGPLSEKFKVGATVPKDWLWNPRKNVWESLNLRGWTRETMPGNPIKFSATKMISPMVEGIYERFETIEPSKKAWAWFDPIAGAWVVLHGPSHGDPVTGAAMARLRAWGANHGSEVFVRNRPGPTGDIWSVEVAADAVSFTAHGIGASVEAAAQDAIEQLVQVGETIPKA